MPDTRYAAAVLQRFAAPAHAGEPAADPGRVVSGAAGEREHGTQLRFAVRIQGDQVAEARFRAYGCPHVIAACELAAEWLTGAPVARLASISAGELARALAAPPEKLGRLLLVEDALRKCGRAWDNNQLSVTEPQGGQ